MIQFQDRRRSSWCTLPVLVLAMTVCILAPVSAAEHVINSADSIQAAINSAADGDTILLNSGTYSQYDISVTKNITIGANTAAGANAANTFIDAGNAGRIFSVTGGYNLTVDSLTLQNGQAPKGTPASYAEPGGNGGSGGCIFSDGLVTVTSSIIRDCHAGKGGDGYPGPNEMDAGTVGGDGGNGGAIYTSDEAVIDATTITRCYAGDGGAYGTYFAGTGAKGGDGGALYAMNFLTVTSSTISDCRAGNAGTSPADGGPGGNGGGIRTANYTYPISSMTMRFTTITNCSAGKAGDAGANYEDGGSGGGGGGIYSSWPTTITSSTITKCNATPTGTIRIPVSDSAASNGMGGGYMGWNYGGTLTLENSTLTGNWAPKGGGFASDGQDELRVTSSNISYNSASEWGAIYYWGSGTVYVDSSTLVGNTGGGIYTYVGQLQMNRFYNNQGMAVKTAYAGEIDAKNNWWGFNSGSLGNTSTNVTYSPWLMLCATASLNEIPLGEGTMIRPNLTFNSAGEDTSSIGFLPAGTPISYTVTGGGLFLPSAGNLTNGVNTSVFRPSITGTSTANSLVDGQSVGISIFVPVNARFTGAPSSGAAPLAVQFNDTSDCTAPLTWNWSFGDGAWFNTSDILQRNATHTYSDPGTFSVSLTVASAEDSNTTAEAGFITTRIPPPSVSRINPATGVNSTTIGIANLTGTYFNTTVLTTTVRLNRTGYADIPATAVTVLDSTNITCTFDLTHQPAGSWNVVVKNPDLQEGMLAGAFEIQTPSPAVSGITPSLGSNSTTVAVTDLAGTGFWPGALTTTVKLNGTGYPDIAATSVQVPSATKITCSINLTDQRIGLRNVVVTNPDGKTAVLANAFEVKPPVPTITGVAPSGGLVTGGTFVTITGRGFTNASSVMFGTTATSAYTVNSDTEINATSPAHAAGTVDILITTDGGTNPAGAPDRFIYAYVAAPVADFSGTPLEGQAPLTVTFTDRSTNDPATWQWSFGDGNTSIVQSPTHTFTKSGAYTISLNATNDLGGTTKTRTGYVTVTATTQNTDPVVDGITYGTSGGNQTAVVNLTQVKGTVTQPDQNSVVIQNPEAGWSEMTLVSTGPVTNTGGNLNLSDISEVVMTTEPVTATLNQSTIGTVSVQITIPMTQVPTGLSIQQTIYEGANQEARNAFQLAATSSNLNVDAVAYTVEIRNSAPFNANLTGASNPVTLTMSVNHAWVVANGGTDAIRIIRSAEDGTKEVLATRFVSYDPATGKDSFEGTSIKGLSVFGIAAVSGLSSSAVFVSGGDADPDTPATAPVTTVRANVGGNSGIKSVSATGAGISGLIVTGITRTGLGTGIPAAPGTVYQYISLTPARYTTITAAEIAFTVPTAWLNEHGFTPQDIILSHYTNGVWMNLPTTVGTTKDGQVSFTAASPSFSLFAISGVHNDGGINATEPVTTAAIRETDTPATPAATTRAPVAAVKTTTMAPAEPAPPSATFPLMTVALIGAGTIVLVGSGWYIRRWWRRRQNPALFREYD